jgi:hypothetical protein
MLCLLLNTLDPPNLKNYIRIVAYALDLRRASFHDLTDFVRRGDAFKFEALSNLIKTVAQAIDCHSSAEMSPSASCLLSRANFM